MDNNWMVLLQQTNLTEIIETNQTAVQFGLILSEQDAKLILKERNNALREQRRVEFSAGINGSCYILYS